MSAPAQFPPQGFAVISAAPKWLPAVCTFVRGFVVDPRRDGIGILVLECSSPDVAVGEVRHLAFAPHLCELDALKDLIVDEESVDAEGNVTRVTKTAEVALTQEVGAKNWTVALRVTLPNGQDAEPVRMEEALQAVLAAREAAKANVPTPSPAPVAEIAGAPVVVVNTPATP